MKRSLFAMGLPPGAGFVDYGGGAGAGGGGNACPAVGGKKRVAGSALSNLVAKLTELVIEVKELSARLEKRHFVPSAGPCGTPQNPLSTLILYGAGMRKT